MTIEQLSSLYAKGLYSPINYYYDLVAMLRSGADFDRAMSSVPPPFLPQIKEFAARSWHSAREREEISPEERMLERRIVLWGESPEKQRLLDPAPPEPRVASARPALSLSPANLEMAQQARRGSAILKFISSPIRLRIVLWLVEDEKTGKPLTRALKRSPATYAHHLALLRQSGFVASKRGRTTIYRLTRKGKELAEVAQAVLAFEEKPAKSR